VNAIHAGAGGAADLDAADCAVLDRLRAVALLLAAAGPWLPVVPPSIGLRIDRHGLVLPFECISWDARLYVAQTMGWDEVRVAMESPDTYSADFFHALFMRIAAAEFPTGCPPGLTKLLQHIRRDPKTLSTASLDFLARARWSVCSFEGLILPAPPDSLSVHELLDALALVEGEEETGRPLTRLAHQAAAHLLEGEHP